MTVCGQAVIGAPGAGKSTYCHGVQQLLGMKKRRVTMVNLDPANDALPYRCDVDVRDLVIVEDAMKKEGLGPNGAMMHCMETLEANLDWLKEQVEDCEPAYIVMDLPGQVELYTHHQSIVRILAAMQSWGIQLCIVHLVDAMQCYDAWHFLSATTMCLASMIHLELPTVNILSKIDLVSSFGELPFDIEYYTEAADLGYLLHYLPQDALSDKLTRLSKELIDMVESFGLVGFKTLDVMEKKSLEAAITAIDQANGYVYTDKEHRVLDQMFNFGVEARPKADEELVGQVKERNV